MNVNLSSKFQKQDIKVGGVTFLGLLLGGNFYNGILLGLTLVLEMKSVMTYYYIEYFNWIDWRELFRISLIKLFKVNLDFKWLLKK